MALSSIIASLNCARVCNRTLYKTPLRSQCITFVVTFLSYVSYHATRKAFSNVKPNFAAPYCDGIVDAHDASDASAMILCTQNNGLACALQNGGNLTLCDTWFGPFGATTSALATLDTGFLFAYAVGLYISGWLLDRINVRWAIAVSMALAGVCCFAFALFGALQIRSVWPYAVVWTLNGLVQSAGWPGNVAIMAAWFPKIDDDDAEAASGNIDTAIVAIHANDDDDDDGVIGAESAPNVSVKAKVASTFCRRGWVLGLWAANASVGNIVGARLVVLAFQTTPHIAAAAPDNSGDWRVAMALPAVFIWVMAVVFLVLVRLPTELLETTITTTTTPLSESESESECENEEAKAMVQIGVEDDKMAAEAEEAAGEEQGIGFFRAWCIPGVPFYAFSYLCLKLVNYCLFFWLPLYLSNTIFDHSADADTKADSLSQLYDVGQIGGGFIGGMISDYLLRGRRGVLFVAMMLPVAISFFFFNSADLHWLYFLIPFAGFMVGGPANLMSSAIAADLSNDPSVGGERGTATVVGIIDGTGSIGAAGGSYLLAYLAACKSIDGVEACHWSPVFLMLITSCFLSCLCLGPIVYKDLKFFFCKQQRPRSSSAASAYAEISS